MMKNALYALSESDYLLIEIHRKVVGLLCVVGDCHCLLFIMMLVLYFCFTWIARMGITLFVESRAITPCQMRLSL